LELLLDEVDEFKKLCIHNLMIQIDIQKIFINAHHLDFKKDFIKPEPMVRFFLLTALQAFLADIWGFSMVFSNLASKVGSRD